MVNAHNCCTIEKSALQNEIHNTIITVNLCAILKMLQAIYLKYKMKCFLLVLALGTIIFGNSHARLSNNWETVFCMVNSIYKLSLPTCLQFQKCCRNLFGNMNLGVFLPFWYRESTSINIFRQCSMSFIQKSQNVQSFI